MQHYSLFQAVKIIVRFAAPCVELSASHYILFPLSSQIDRKDKNVADIYPHKIRLLLFTVEFLNFNIYIFWQPLLWLYSGVKIGTFVHKLSTSMVHPRRDPISHVIMWLARIVNRFAKCESHSRSFLQRKGRSIGLLLYCNQKSICSSSFPKVSMTKLRNFTVHLHCSECMYFSTKHIWG